MESADISYSMVATLVSVLTLVHAVSACSGREGEEYILHITILLTASSPVFHETAKLDSLLSFAAPESQQVYHCKMPDLDG